MAKRLSPERLAPISHRGRNDPFPQKMTNDPAEFSMKQLAVSRINRVNLVNSVDLKNVKNLGYSVDTSLHSAQKV